MTNFLIKTLQEGDRAAKKLIDAFCEPNVRNTNNHPNCEYVFSCEGMEEFEKALESSHHSRSLKLLESLRKQYFQKGDMQESIALFLKDIDEAINLYKK